MVREKTTTQGSEFKEKKFCVCAAESELGQECAFGDIRLEDGLISEGFGRVEVCFNGEWGVVCNHEFEDVDAAVACRQLGFDSALRDFGERGEKKKRGF